MCNRETSFLWRRIRDGRGDLFYLKSSDHAAVRVTQKLFFRFVNWIMRGTTPYKRTAENKALYKALGELRQQLDEYAEIYKLVSPMQLFLQNLPLLQPKSKDDEH